MVESLGMFISLFSFILGLAAGSFVNVLAGRTIAGQSIIRPPSACDSCHKPIRRHDLIPIASFLTLRGRCRFCRSNISWQYPIVEVATGILFAAAAREFSLGWPLAVVWISIVTLAALFLTDLRAMALPDRITIPAIVAISALQLIFLGVGPKEILIASAVGGGFFLIQYVVSRGQWIGSGDIRLGILMGVVLDNWQRTASALLISYILGSLAAIFLLATQRKNLKSEIPLGVFLVIGTLIVLLVNAQLFNRWSF